MADIYHQVLINASREKVYDAITTWAGVSKWWTRNCSVRQEVGFINEIRTEQGTHRMKVLVLDPAAFAEWVCYSDNNAWNGTHLTFSLSDKGNLTCLDFRHLGFRETDEVYASANFQWANHLFMLKEFCETGRSLLDTSQERRETHDVMNYGED